MTETLLRTKLYIPRANSNLVPRPRLSERLDAGMLERLTLISAPAGSGKTTLLSEWRMLHLDADRPLAWISLDETDNSPVRFWSYMVAALRGAMAEDGIGEEALAMLRSPEPPAIESILTALLNDLSDVPHECALVLDDYHVIEDEAIHRGVDFLLDHLPPALRIVISSRTEPPLPLSRLRARGQMTEIRASDLRFTNHEAEDFLNRVMGLELSAGSVASLEERTEGWAAGLQLAALSAQGREDASELIAEISGGHRYLLDYLGEEILHRQPEDVQSFLLQTSVLHRLNGSLCDAVTDGGGGQSMLERLEVANLFIVPLDEERRWYRYHHLFSEFLYERLTRTRPDDEVAELRRRASEWCEKSGLADEAIRYALAAEDFERAVRLIEEVGRNMLMSGEVVALLTWIEDLPPDVIRSRPQLCLFYAWELAAYGEISAAERWLETADEALAGTEDRRLSGEAAVIRAYIARVREDMPSEELVEVCEKPFRILSPGESFLRGVALLNLGYAHRLAGDTEAAVRTFTESEEVNRKTGNTHAAVVAACNLATIRMAEGRPREADEIYRRTLRFADERGGKRLPAVGRVYVGLGELRREWDDLDAAERYITEGVELGRWGSVTEMVLEGFVSLSRIRWARGDVPGAFEELEKVEGLARKHDHLSSRFAAGIEAHKARLHIARGNLEEASRWAREASLDEVSGGREVEYRTLARLRAAEGKTGEALETLERLQEIAESAGYGRSLIEVLVLKALVLRSRKDFAGATSALEQALSLAEPEGYIRAFADEGAPLADLLSRLLEKQRRSGVSAEYIGRLPAAFEGGSLRKRRGSQPLADPLSERELEVLGLVASGMKNQEIAGELFVTLGTVKTHVNHIYHKLEVRNRTQAVARARELGLI